MSEDTSSNANNLCIPEDAFEQFQAVSMYEEEELITLSDIVSPTPQPVSLADDLDAIPYDNEVVLTSNYDEFQNTETFTGNGLESTSALNIPEPSTDQHDSRKQSSDESILQNAAPQTATKSRRGRKKKTETNMTNRPPDVGVEVDVLTNKSDITITAKPLGAKKGRKRKSEVVNNATTTSEPRMVGNDPPTELQLPKRSGRKRKTLEINEIVTPNNDPIVPPQILNNNGSHKKRGRKPKNPQLLPTDVTIPQESNNIVKTVNKSNKKDLCMAPETYLAGLENAPASVSNDDDDGDDLLLSQLKETLDTKPDTNNLENTDLLGILNSTIEDEIPIDQQLLAPALNGEAETLTLGSDNDNANQNSVQNPAVNSSTEIQNESLLVEDTSKRPKRRKIKQPIHYDNDSDEDPFANVELSDDEPRKKKGTKYYSDDEYVPGKRGKKGKHDVSSSDSFDSDIDDIEENKKGRNKRFGKKSDNISLTKSPRKGPKKSEPDVTTIVPNLEQDDDIEVCLQTSVIKANENLVSNDPSLWSKSNEFENFIAKKTQGTGLKIKKVTAKEPSTTLEIPTINPNEAKKTVENSTQTNRITTKAVAIQATTLAELPMKENVALTAEQTAKACEFLKGIVKTTSELGELMTQKSEDFIQKKINADHVTDTFKMDYCIKKSFLLLKLAKHNLTQLEDDLSKQYDDFLKINNLSIHREEEKTVSASIKAADSDSDCEIVDVQPKPKEKPKFNAKTVFLNKELSIKIAKKPSEEKIPKKSEIKIPGSHAVWLNDSIMVKKVKPTQSFLAQDSRNKKPPDFVITEKMVNDFFIIYNRQRALSICSPLVSKEWLWVNKEETMCNYFFVKTDDKYDSNASFSNDQLYTNNPINNSDESRALKIPDIPCQPKSLLTLCTQFLKRYLTVDQPVYMNGIITDTASKSSTFGMESLTKLCINTITKNYAFLKEENGEKKKGDDFSLSQLNEKLDTEPHSNNLEITDLTTFETLCFMKNARPLKSLCLKVVTELLLEAEANSQTLIKEEIIMSPELHLDNNHNMCSYVKPKIKNSVKSLQSMCVQSVNNCFQSSFNAMVLRNKYEVLAQPLCLKQIVFRRIKNLLYSKISNKQVITLANICYDAVVKYHFNVDNNLPCDESALTINCVNSLSEEAFLRLEESSLDVQAPTLYSDEETNNYDDEFDGYEDFNNEASPGETVQSEDSSWVGQLQMKELTSVSMAEKTKSAEYKKLKNEIVNSPIETGIKLEPSEDYTESEATLPIIKTEPIHHFDEMTVIPEAVVTKLERSDLNPLGCDLIASENGICCDINSFETFAGSNKIITALDYCKDIDDIFSQSAARIRRQHEPDSDPENEMGEVGLLVPQTFEPLNIETAKGTLMESSSDDSSSSSNKKSLSKKKLDKRKLKKVKKGPDPKQNKNLTQITTKGNDPPKKVYSNQKKIVATDNNEITNEVAMLTRRMREKIRQEEKKVVSSDSETENISLKKRKDKKKIEKNETSKRPSTIEDEIQCSNVDSTENFINNGEDQTFSGFSALDQNEISSYHKYVKYVYDKIIPNETEENATHQAVEDNTNRITSPVMNPDDPVELLECEPTMPIFDEKPTRKKANYKKKTIEEKSSLKERPYQDRHGWKCYFVDSKDVKLCSDPQIILEKLPESFVETYFRYQDVADHCKDDVEVDRLINLQSLNRSATAKDIKRKVTNRAKSGTGETSGPVSGDDSRLESPNDHHFDELMPSDDEANVDDELPPPAPRQASSDNYLAKNSLMDDNESDSENPNKTIKKEKSGITNEHSSSNKNSKRLRTGPKSKTNIKSENPDDLMLTADKMMNKELTMLHAPVVLDDNVTQAPHKGPSTKHKYKSSRGESSHGRSRSKDDSSSEEEKQWVNTKEKLLKRMGQKNYQPNVDDAKRAKIVSEFIERRGEGFSRKKKSGRRKLSTRKFMEKQKQLRVLSRELFGEASGSAKYTNQSLFKGRRNIRKVIDKKSLARSTVIANMEEFERKRRLIMKLNRLRELLGCDDDVNVLVINDEVCLEYDFDEGQPIVSIHPFFTKVMKAHQYEGVKFMWDACFESLELVESGHGGGGCILAHCMGLGKTLQVLALLHTVLTHPRANMKRVLVCCPLSTVLNWVDEIHKWIGPVTDQIKVFELSKLKKTYERAYQLEDWYNGGGIFIIGYELFRSLSTIDPDLDDVRPTIVSKIRTALLDPGPDIIICDEGHLLKNDCSVLAVAMSRVVTKRRIILTGTPMQNNLREYYCMVDFVKPNLLGTYSEYSNRFENPIMNGQHRDSVAEDIKLMKARTHILHKVLEGCLQRQEASVLYPYLPKKHEYTVFIPLTQCQIDLYKHYLDEYSRKTKQSILRDFHTLQKIWTHPQVLHHFQVKARDQKAALKPEKLEDDLAHEDLAASEDMKPATTETWWLQYLDGGSKLDCLESSNKFIAVFRILEECIALGDKVLIFSTSLFTMDALEYFLRKINKWSLGQEYYRLDGSVPPEVRQKWCREFNADNNLKTKLFLISTRAGSLGLNMTAANRVIILDTSWNPAHDIQSIFRVYRFGQKKDCYIYRLVALGTMEQKIYERSVTKQAVACRVVDEQLIDRHYNMAELTELYRFDEVGTGVAGGVAVGVHDVALLRVARDAQLHAVHEHDSLLRGSSEQGLEEHERAAAWTQFQQEQTHKQIQNQLIPVSETRTKSVDQLSHIKTEDSSADYQADKSLPKKGRPPKIKEEYVLPSLEPVHARLWSGQEIKVEKEDDYAPAISERVKLRKGHKTIINCNIPIRVEPEPTKKSNDTSNPLDPVNEDAMVKKIMDILIRYDYHTSRSHSDINKLIKNVRRAVASGDLSKLSESDQVTQNIASVLMNKKPPIERVQPDITPKLEPKEYIAKKRGRPKKVKKGRPRKKYIPSIEINSDTDTCDPIGPIDKPVSPPKVNHNSNRTVSSLPEPEPVVDGTILLSDDDEPAPVEKSTPEEPEKPVEVAQKPAEPVEKIPLHPSLLSNKNFIQIVAHTYLKNNSSLDEDAAILAAEYSSYKALNEIKTSGTPLDSGPLHDIAVEVLGIEVMKKLNAGESNQNKDVIAASALQPPESEKPLNLVRIRREHMMVEVKKELESHGFKSISQRLENLTTPVSQPQAVQPDVVPVGFIKRGPAPVNESILPDDDDVCITSDPIPSTSSAEILPAPSPAPVTKKTTLVRKTKPGPASKTLLPLIQPTHTVAKPVPRVVTQTPHVVPQTPPVPVAPVMPGSKLLIPRPTLGPKVSAITVANKKICLQPIPCAASNVSNTISLDSDDDDVITPSASEPVPTGLFMRAAPSMVIPISMDNPVPLVPMFNQPTLVQIDPQTRLPQSTILNVERIANPQQPTPPTNLLKITKEEFEAVMSRRYAKLNTPDSGAKVKTIKLVKMANPPNFVENPKPGDVMHITNKGSIVILNKQLALEDEEKAKRLAQDQIIDLEPDKSVNPVKNKPSSKPLLKSNKSANLSSRPTMLRKPNTSSPSVPQKANLDKGKKEIKKSVITEDSRKLSNLQKAKPTAESSLTKPANIERGNKRSLSISSSSSSSRPSSPDDPLSILKDVVHIKAPEDNTKLLHPKSYSRNNPNTINHKVLTYEQAKQVISKNATNKTMTNQKPPSQSLLKNTDTKITLTKGKPPPAVANWMIPKANRESVSSQVTTKSVDLTKSGPTVSKKPKSKPTLASPGAVTATVEGISKNIVIGGNNATLLTNASASRIIGKSTVRVTSIEKIVPVSNDKKRNLREPDVSVAKKKKSEPPKTLKDFNIDDFDDIIELE